jgi:uncharacterized membrane protein
MENAIIPALTIAAAIGCGIMAGIYAAFSVSVMPGLARRPPLEGAAAMRTINIAILNPFFFAIFFGPALLSAALATVSLLDWSAVSSIWLLTGSALYLVGSIGITMVVNVPLNNALLAAAPESPETAALWAGYLKDWTAWNHARGLATAAASLAFVLALL